LEKLKHSMIMKSIKYIYPFNVCLLVLLLLMYMVSSCNKPGGDYNYVNTENTYSGTDYEYIAGKAGVYDSLVKAINRVPWLKDSLSNEATSLTLFAPSNASFRLIMSTLNIARASAGKSPLYISDLDVPNLDSVISRYVIRGRISTSSIQFVDGLDLTSILNNYPMHGQRSFSEASGFQAGGPTNIIFSDTKKSPFIRDWIRTQTNVVNIVTKNGVVHSLQPEHELGFGEFISRFNK